MAPKASTVVLVTLLMALAMAEPEGNKRSAEQLLTRVMRNDFLIRALRSQQPGSRPDQLEEVPNESQLARMMSQRLLEENGRERRYDEDFLARAMRSSDYFARSMRSANHYLVRTMRSS